MHALEDEPESGDRWRRLGIGALITAAVLVSFGYGAQRFEPTRRLIQKVVQMTVVSEPLKKEALPPPRTEPPPPPPKRAPPPRKTAAKESAAPPKAANPLPASSDPVVGLDDGSFGSGDGASFQVGTTQMGDPVTVARAPAAAPPAAPAQRPKLIPAGVPARADRCRYSPRAQRLGLEGMMIIEVDVDSDGRVTKAELRKRLEDELDRECLEAIRASRFQPATLGGEVVASTRMLRLRFELER